jgi:hypothetical protein
VTHRAADLDAGDGFRRPDGSLAHVPRGKVKVERLVRTFPSVANRQPHKAPWLT